MVEPLIDFSVEHLSTCFSLLLQLDLEVRNFNGILSTSWSTVVAISEGGNTLRKEYFPKHGEEFTFMMNSQDYSNFYATDYPARQSSMELCLFLANQSILYNSNFSMFK